VVDVLSLSPILTDLPGGYDNVVPPGGNVIPMGTIRERVRKDGSTAYLAQIVIKRKGKPTYREAETFDRRSEAVAYLRVREPELKSEGGIERARVRGTTIGDTIDKYVDESLKEIGRTKAQVLRSIKKYDLADIEADKATSQDIVAFARELSKTMQPQTVGNYLSHLGAVIKLARPAWGIQVDPLIMKDAFVAAKALGLTSKSVKRQRRPTLGELDKLMDFFGQRQERAPEAVPMQKVIAYAIFSTRRQDEIGRPLWKHLDEEHTRLFIEDMKHPGQKLGNDVWVDLTPEALAIIKSMPRGPGRIFPYSADAISAAFTRACYTLGINTKAMPDEDRLHFHDLRHEGVSRLFEMGWDIPHVALVSAHRSWSSLQRYAQIRQRGDKFKDWKWLPIVT
jgi:integrase